ncbi:hypothetical protein AB0I68_19495 [Streptomyces sp. NPDC050448]|uniref:hypothetical protein n=1 Tax=Streptomyces sp. NPDC050448 TaxID=3155404 RepID=UPI00344739AF
MKLTFLPDHTRGSLNLTGEALLFPLTVASVAWVGRVVSAVVASVTASLLLSCPPKMSWAGDRRWVVCGAP